MPVSTRAGPWWAFASLACALGAVPVGRVVADLLGPKDDPTGFGGLAVALTAMMVLFTLGLACGWLGWRRGERPRLLPVVAIFLNGAGISMVLMARY